LILGVCHDWPATGHHGCHERIHDDGDKALIGQARGLALARFAARHDLAADLDANLDMDPLDAMRVLVRLLEDRASEEPRWTA
jgi:hypothetical protein